MKRLSKLHRDAAMLCSAYATLYADDNWTMPSHVMKALGVALETHWLASRAVAVSGREFVSMRGIRRRPIAVHWALAASVLLNGEVTR